MTSVMTTEKNWLGILHTGTPPPLPSTPHPALSVVFGVKVHDISRVCHYFILSLTCKSRQLCVRLALLEACDVLLAEPGLM